MKPSERILDRATELKRVTEKMDLDRGEIRDFDPMAASTIIEALMEHLDEREELERRRRAFARAHVTCTRHSSSSSGCSRLVLLR